MAITDKGLQEFVKGTAALIEQLYGIPKKGGNMSLKDRFLRKFVTIYNAVPNKKGVRLQKNQWIEKYCGQIFTITIERGDKLN